jgi:hypothetical protein
MSLDRPFHLSLPPPLNTQHSPQPRPHQTLRQGRLLIALLDHRLERREAGGDAARDGLVRQ